MSIKHEWRKSEKSIYLPKSRPEIVDIPKYKFFTIEGAGSPDSDLFTKSIEALYSLSYGVKMGLKKGAQPEGYYDYTVYPLEGIWDINEEAKKVFDGTLNRDDLVFKLMIRQPDFIDVDLFERVRSATEIKKPNDLLRSVHFEEIKEGRSIQMLHVGSFDSEDVSFKIMEDFAEKSGVERVSKVHKEIYLSNPMRVTPDKLKTVLRFSI